MADDLSFVETLGVPHVTPIDQLKYLSASTNSTCKAAKGARMSGRAMQAAHDDEDDDDDSDNSSCTTREHIQPVSRRGCR